MSNAIASVPQTPGGALSARSIASTAGPDLMNLHELVTTMKGTLDHLGGVFDSLGEQTARVASLGPALHATHHIRQLRKQMVVQDRRQEERIQEIKTLLRDVLKEQIAEHLRVHVTRIIREQIQAKVKEQVAAKLNAQFPEALRKQVAQHKDQLHNVKRGLWDANARRHNSQFKSHQFNEPLQPLLMPSGEPSERFPKTLGEMFSADAATAKQLVIDYGLPVAEGPDEREENLNVFMHHAGTAFHMLPPPPRPPFPSLLFAS
ncbi:hypothetical protein BS47DRAFT_507552 [Hydnum rufescens UP504]|uniref:Uncharacterized protein n=1 Tax=Hydnum rufescens UP504 TaxID=1448309 RepID=A0A9P6E0A5_9AGAM|nr:hypothetical protein BS47DRAFT_507552 [Hydnum rufescens UP504]